MKDPPVRKSKPPPEIPKEEVSRRERKQSQQARSRSKNKIQQEFRRPDPPPLPESAAEASDNWFANVDIPARPKRDPPKHKPPPVGLGQTPKQPPQGAAPSAPGTAATGSLVPHRDTDLNRGGHLCCVENV